MTNPTRPNSSTERAPRTALEDLPAGEEMSDLSPQDASSAAGGHVRVGGGLLAILAILYLLIDVAHVIRLQ